ncbi:MAG: YggS family pyridoxal phosphate-dependent enzyme [Dehalococcoidia bacterium]|nr:YggS family pyridoxal phosphate-dependent enzyme [Dehalococcoidia bacterium]
MDIEHNIQAIKSRIARACERAGRSSDEITLIAITKTVDPAAIRAAFQAGIRHFGENRIQEAQSKFPQLQDVRSQSTWHLVGHLQTNKAKTAVELFDIIQSVDSLRLAEFISRHIEHPIPVLLEVNAGGEASKGGFSPVEISSTLKSLQEMPALKVEGLMTVAPLVSDPEEVRPVFRRLWELGNALGLKELSMGMSDDFEVAIEEGATMIRVGRGIFGERRA